MTLVAVSKTFAAEAIEPVIAAGHLVFGENRVQEAKAKWPPLLAKHPGLALHMIGPLQSNKAREAVALFDAIGIGQWFRYVTGHIEVGSAIALLVPSVAVFGALALVATMVGAIVTHLFIVGGSPAMPVILLLGSAAVVWMRRHQVDARGDRRTASGSTPVFRG